MGRIILNSAGNIANLFLGLGDIVMFPIQVAFAYWMRCGEFSADRASVVYDGNAEKTIEMCMRFSGFDKDINAEANVDAFMEQATQYKEMIDENKVNKVMEFMMFKSNTHPLNAVRAYEINEWQKSESFKNIKNYIDSNDYTKCEMLPLAGVSDLFLEKHITFVDDKLTKAGFTNVELIRRTQSDSKKNIPSTVSEIAINGKTKFKDADWYSRDSIIEVTYYLPESIEEIADAHPGQAQIPNSSKGYIGKNCDETVDELKELGFTNISVFEQEGPKIALFRKENSIARITINGQNQFEMGNWFSTDAIIRITYNTF
jgi:hypothetical protein